MRRADLAGCAALLFAGCMIGPPAMPPPDENARPQTRMLRVDLDRVWKTVKAILEEEHMTVDDEDRATGMIVARRVRRFVRPREGEVEREIGRVADPQKARAQGLRIVSEVYYQYAISVTALSPTETRLEIRCGILAIDRSEAIVMGPGMVHVIPRGFQLASRGVLERELMRRVGSELFSGEELLYFLGELGRD